PLAMRPNQQQCGRQECAARPNPKTIGTSPQRLARKAWEQLRRRLGPEERSHSMASHWGGAEAEDRRGSSLHTPPLMLPAHAARMWFSRLKQVSGLGPR